MSNLVINSMRGYGKLTQNAGTVITRLIEPVRGSYTRLASVWYTASATAHTLTVMRPLGVTTFTAAAAASQAVVNIAADPGDYATTTVADNLIAGSDFVVYESAYPGLFVLDTVSSVSSLAITLATNLPTGGVLQGGKFWFFGVIGDTNPSNGLVHSQFTLAANVTTYLGSDPGESIAGFIGTIPGYSGSGLSGMYEPMILHSGNATNAGVLEKVTAIYTGR